MYENGPKMNAWMGIRSVSRSHVNIAIGIAGFSLSLALYEDIHSHPAAYFYRDVSFLFYLFSVSFGIMSSFSYSVLSGDKHGAEIRRVLFVSPSLCFGISVALLYAAFYYSYLTYLNTNELNGGTALLGFRNMGMASIIVTTMFSFRTAAISIREYWITLHRNKPGKDKKSKGERKERNHGSELSDNAGLIKTQYWLTTAFLLFLVCIVVWDLFAVVQIGQRTNAFAVVFLIAAMIALLASVVHYAVLSFVNSDWIESHEAFVLYASMLLVATHASVNIILLFYYCT